MPTVRQNLTWQKLTLETKVPFQLAYGVTEARTIYWIRLTADEGWGEAAIPPYYGIAEQEMVQLWRNKSAADMPLPDQPEEIATWVGRKGPAPARCALDIALHDRLARRQGVPLHALLGLPRPGEIETAYTIPIAAPGKMADMAVQAGAFKTLKIKLGSDDDHTRLAAVRQARPDVRLIVDANAAWSADEAVEHIRRLDTFDLALVEQPVPAEDRQGLGYVQRHLSVPILADESVQSLADLEELAECGVRAVNLKLQKIGGLAPCLTMIRRARQLGMQILLGCMIESSLGVTAMAHLSALADWFDLDAPLLVANDPFVGVTYDGARLSLPREPGVGVRRRTRPAS